MTHASQAAFVRRDWRIARSYRFPFVAGLASSFLSIALYFYLSHVVRAESLPAGSGREQGYFAFALVGIVVSNLVQIGLYSVAQRIREDQVTGTLEILVAMPISSRLVAIGSTWYEMLYGLASGAVSAAIAIALFGMSFDIHGSAVPALVLAACGILVLVGALAIAVAALTVIFKETIAIVALISVVLILLSGVYYPVDALPPLLRAISWASPLRWALDVVRPALFGGDVPGWELAGLLAAAALTVPLALLGFDRALTHIKRTGTLNQY